MANEDPPALSDFDLDSFTPYRLAVAAKRLSEGLARLYRTRFDISIPEWRVLVHLVSAGDSTSVRDIEARVGLERYEVSRTATRLVTRGLIQKTSDVTDRRLVSLYLTDAGHVLMADLLPIARDYQTRFEARMGDAMAGLETGLDRLLHETE